ncbi:MAG: glycoside hydrolase family 3 protein [Rhodothermales bacterium]|nr:glycoside hydrolase family 3 protein [Rhodothermales bacterium]
MDSLFAHFPKKMLAPTECDTSGVSTRILDRLNSMSLRSQLAQLFIVPLQPGQNGLASPRAMSLVRETKIGGFLVPRLMSPEQIAVETAQLQFESDIPLFIAADYERGVGRFNNAFTELPSNMGLGATGRPWLGAVAGRLTGMEARAIGVNLLFAPVVDVNSNPDNPIINIRAFGDDPEKVAELSAAFLSEVQRYGVVATAKHFPGHGNSDVDSHSGLPVVSGDIDRDLIPYRRLITSRMPPEAVMIGHIAVPGIDSLQHPASLSRELAINLLSSEIGFRGLKITDDLRMAALSTVGFDEKILMAFLAGNDILLTPEDAVDAIDVLMRAVERGSIDSVDVARRAARVLAAKDIACFGNSGARSHVSIIERDAPGEAIAEFMARQTISSTEDYGNFVGRPGEIRVLQFVNATGSQTIEDAMRRFDALANLEPGGGDKLNVVVLYSRLVEGSGTAGFGDEVLGMAEDFLGSTGRGLVIILGNPYLAERFVGTPVLIGYDQSSATVGAMLGVIKGENKPAGQIPVTMRDRSSD